MPLAGPVLGSTILLEFQKAGFTGSQSTNLANAIGMGIINEILKSNSYAGTATGTGPGSGVGTGFVQGVVGTAVGSSIFGFMGSMGLTGTQANPLALAVGNAFATHIKTGIVNSTSAPVGIGSGTGSILGVVGKAVGSSIQQMMGSFALTGEYSGDLANAIGEGIATSISSATVTTIITGAVAGPPAGPVASTGIDQGKLV